MSYKCSATDLWEEDISSDLLRFGFLIFCVIGGQGCPHTFGRFVLDTRVGFSLRIYELNKVIEHLIVFMIL
jgi:hypothetical protein